MSSEPDEMASAVERWLRDNPPLTNAALRSQIAALQAELAEARKQALTEAHRIAMAAQYSKTPATDTMRGIERLLQDGPYPAGNCPP